MKKFENKPEATPKYKSGKTAMATTAALENWEPTTAICPECGSRHAAINTMCVLNAYPEQYQYKCSDCGHRWTGYKVQYIGPIQFWPNLEYEDVTPVGQMGWICPKCGRVYSPTTNQCLFCGGSCPPNVGYCESNNGTKDIFDTITICNTADSSKINTTQHNIKQDFDLQNIKTGKGLQQSNCYSNKYESFKQQHGE